VVNKRSITKPFVVFTVGAIESPTQHCMQAKTPNGITGKARETLARIFDHVLKDECLLSATTRDYRWNVTGPNLYSLHRLFDEQRRQLDEWLDQLIERAKSFGFGARASLEQNVQLPAADAVSGAGLPAGTMVVDLLLRHEEMAHRLREDIARLNDPVTADLLMRMVEFHETTAWMLRMVNHGSHPDRAI
jgi:starvation-inducible DNA-binding protein